MSKEPRYLQVSTYARLCDTSAHTIYQRIYKSEKGKIKEGSKLYLEQTLLDEVDGVFIDSHQFPPVRMRKAGGGRKKKIPNEKD